MLRKLSTPLLFCHSHSTRNICLKQCGTHKSNEHTDANPDNKVKHIGGTLMLGLILNPPTFKNTLFPAIFRVPTEQVPTLLDIIHQAPNFNELIENLPKTKTRLLAKTIAADMTTLQKTLAPLSSRNQRRVLDFIGLDKILAINEKDSLLASESHELAFFMVNESLNHVLRRKNHDYLYEMHQRTQVNIAAKPTSSD